MSLSNQTLHDAAAEIGPILLNMMIPVKGLTILTAPHSGKMQFCMTMNCWRSWRMR